MTSVKHFACCVLTGKFFSVALGIFLHRATPIVQSAVKALCYRAIVLGIIILLKGKTIQAHFLSAFRKVLLQYINMKLTSPPTPAGEKQT